MKTHSLILLALILSLISANAANPAFTDFFGTNGIVIRTNGNKVQVDGSALASTNNAVTLTNLIHTNVTWVAKNGNNTTGVPGNFARPYLSISNAVQASPAPSLIVVEPGVYNESIRLKNDINFHMPSGVIVSQSVANLPVFYDNGSTVTSRLSGDFKIIHTGDGSQTDGIYCFGTDTDIAVDRVTIDVVGSSDYGINMERGNLRAVGTIYSSDHGIGVERINGTGSVSFIGSIFSTNNAAFITGGSAGSNYIRGYFSTEAYNAIQHTLGFILVEDSEVITYSPTHRAIDFQADDMEIRGTKITAVGEEAIGKYGNGFLILTDVQLIGGTNTTYSIDNANDVSNGTTELRTPIWANLPIRPDMTMTSNGFTRLSRYLSITTNDYIFPAVGGFYDSFLRHDGSGQLDWTNALQNLTVVSNFTVFQNTVLSNVTVKGDFFVTNIIMGGVNLRTNQYTTNVSGTPVIGSFWFQGTNGVPVTNNARVALEWIPVMRSLRIGELGANLNGPDVFDSTTAPSNYWHFTNVGFGSIAMGTNVMAKGNYSFIANGIYNITHSNAVASSIGGGSNNIIYTNAIMSVIAGGSDHEIRAGSDRSVISGGMDHTIIGSDWAFVGGGQGHTIGIGSDNSTIVGGSVNALSAPALYGFIGGGRNNGVIGSDNAIVGGQGNNIAGASGTHNFIGGGASHNINQSSIAATIAGGSDNDIGVTAVGAGNYSFIGGGQTQRINGAADYGFIGGGTLNLIETSRDFGAILAGVSNNVNTTAMGTIVGNFITNTTDKSVEIGQGDAGGNNRKLRVNSSGARVMTYNGSATVGGTYLITNTPIASAGAAETNLQVVTIGAHVLTNSNDRLLFRASGRFAATANAKQIKVVYGSETILDTGSQIVNSGAWTIEGEIIRTGNTSQSANVEFNGAGITLFTTANSLDLAQTNGIATVLKITGTAAGDGDITNRTLTVEWRPST